VRAEADVALCRAAPLLADLLLVFSTLEHRMNRRTWTTRSPQGRAGFTSATVAVLVGLAALTVASGSRAEVAARAPVNTLREAFEAAWARQPEAAALSVRRDAVKAQQQSARAWSSAPPTLEVLTKTDAPSRNQGAREIELGVAVPLWLPGERGRSQALADAEGRALESRLAAAQLRVAAGVREAWWSWQRARTEADVARAQQANAGRIAADVATRLKAGDLARADQHQADAAVAAADGALAQANAVATSAALHLRALTAQPSAPSSGGFADFSAQPEPEPLASASGTSTHTHAELAALTDKVAVAEGSAALAATQSRTHPELTLATARGRGAFGEAYNQTFTIGIRLPFGGGPRVEVRTASARADVIELQAQLAMERARLGAEADAAQARTAALRIQLTAAERRASLGRESRGFFDKSFRLGQTDLPTRLRVEAEAADAERQTARARVELAAAISSWRQALGLLPQ
jgi:outer membrane protein, heavy metal efflux system